MKNTKAVINGKQYTVATEKEISSLVIDVTGNRVTDRMVSEHALKYAFGFGSNVLFNFIVTVKLSQDYDLTKNLVGAEEESVICSVKDITVEIVHQVIGKDESLDRIEEAFDRAMKATKALRAQLAEVERVIIPVEQLRF